MDNAVKDMMIRNLTKPIEEVAKSVERIKTLDNFNSIIKAIAQVCFKGNKILMCCENDVREAFNNDLINEVYKCINFDKLNRYESLRIRLMLYGEYKGIDKSYLEGYNKEIKEIAYYKLFRGRGEVILGCKFDPVELSKYDQYSCLSEFINDELVAAFTEKGDLPPVKFPDSLVNCLTSTGFSSFYGMLWGEYYKGAIAGSCNFSNVQRKDGYFIFCSVLKEFKDHGYYDEELTKKYFKLIYLFETTRYSRTFDLFKERISDMEQKASGVSTKNCILKLITLTIQNLKPLKEFSDILPEEKVKQIKEIDDFIIRVSNRLLGANRPLNYIKYLYPDNDYKVYGGYIDLLRENMDKLDKPAKVYLNKIISKEANKLI